MERGGGPGARRGGAVRAGVVDRPRVQDRAARQFDAPIARQGSAHRACGAARSEGDAGSGDPSLQQSLAHLPPTPHALAKADSENLPWVVVLHGDRVRLYPTQMGVGVGRRGRTETYVEVQTSLLSDVHLPFLWLLFSADALQPSGVVDALLDASKRFSGDLAVRLRERI